MNKEIGKLKEKTIQWIKLENEVMTKVHKLLLENKFKEQEWNDFYIDLIRKYGNESMLKAIRIYKNYIDNIKAILTNKI